MLVVYYNSKNKDLDPLLFFVGREASLRFAEEALPPAMQVGPGHNLAT